MFAKIVRSERQALLSIRPGGVLIVTQELPHPHSSAAARQLSRNPRMQLDVMSGRRPRLQVEETDRRFTHSASQVFEVLRGWNLTAAEREEIQALYP